LPSVVGVAAGALLLALPRLTHQYHLAIWMANIPVWVGAMLILGSLLLMWRMNQNKTRYLQHVALLGLLIISMLYVGVIHTAGDACDVRNISYHLKRLEDQKIPLAHIGKYYGQFNFVGRLLKSPEVVSEGELKGWFQSNPQGQVIMYFDKSSKLKGIKPEYMQLYRGSTLVCVLTQSQWQAMSEKSLSRESKVSLSTETVSNE